MLRVGLYASDQMLKMFCVFLGIVPTQDGQLAANAIQVRCSYQIFGLKSISNPSSLTSLVLSFCPLLSCVTILCLCCFLLRLVMESWPSDEVPVVPSSSMVNLPKLLMHFLDCCILFRTWEAAPLRLTGLFFFVRIVPLSCSNRTWESCHSYCKLCSVWKLNERLNCKSMEIKRYKYMKVDP